MRLLTSDEYHQHFNNDGHCRSCGAQVGLGGPGEGDYSFTYGWATLHIEWHSSGTEGLKPWRGEGGTK